MSRRAGQVVVTALTPTVRTGRGLRTYAVVRALAAAAPVELVYVDTGGTPDPEFSALELTLTRLRPSRGFARAVRFGRSLAAGVPAPYARGVSNELVQALHQHLRPQPRGRVIADGPIPAAAAGGRPVVYLAQNIESQVWESVGGRPARALARARRFERRLLQSAEEAWMASDADMAVAADLAPASRLRYVPNAVDVRSIERVNLAESRETVVFVADFTYAPNRHGVTFLADTVMPLLWRARPAARLAVVGRGLHRPRAWDERIEVLGPVRDLREVYARARCAAVPLFAGSGSPLKFIEALAYGMPVVATPQAAGRLRVTRGLHYAEAETAEEFARELAAALADPDVAMADNGRALAQREYSIERVQELVRAGGAVV